MEDGALRLHSRIEATLSPDANIRRQAELDLRQVGLMSFTRLTLCS